MVSNILTSTKETSVKSISDTFFDIEPFDNMIKQFI